MSSGSAVPDPRPGTQPVVLVVDDEPDIRFLLELLLSEAGYRVITAAHGSQALDRVRETRPDLVITDMMMPVMGGRELIQRLRAEPTTRSIPIVQLSSLADPELPTDASLKKPFLPEDLIGVARNLTKRIKDDG